MPPEETYVPYAKDRPAQSSAPPLGESQFSLRFLLIAMAVAAFLFAFITGSWVAAALLVCLGPLVWAAFGLQLCYAAIVHRQEGWGWGLVFGLMMTVPPLGMLAIAFGWIVTAIAAYWLGN